MGSPKEVWVGSFYLSQRFQVDQRTIQRWAQKGYFDVGWSEDQYDLVSADFYYISMLRERLEKQQSEATPKEQLIKAQIAKLEAETALRRLEFDEKRGDLILLDKAVGVIKKCFAKARVKILGFPARYALELAGLSDPRDVESLLENGCREVLDELVVDLEQDADLDEFDDTETD